MFVVLPLVVVTMGARLRALNVTRMLIKHVAAPPILPASSSSSSRGMAVALAHHQQAFTNSYIRNSSTESFSWSVGSEPGASTGAPSPNDDGFSKPSPASAAGAGANQEQRTHSGEEEDAIDEKTQVLRAAMAHVQKLGWTEAALVAGARDAGLSPAIVGSFPRKDAALVEFFMDECNHQLQDEIEAREKELSSMLLADRVAQIVRLRLQMQVPYLSKWAQALSVQAHPLNAPTALKQRAVLMDDIWHGAGDRSTDMDWYTKRALLGGVYTATELYMLTDFSAGHRDTWAFLERRIKDAINCRKTTQEVSHLAQAVGTGLSNSLSGLFNKGFQSPKF